MSNIVKTKLIHNSTSDSSSDEDSDVEVTFDLLKPSTSQKIVKRKKHEQTNKSVPKKKAKLIDDPNKEIVFEIGNKTDSGLSYRHTFGMFSNFYSFMKNIH